jgi:nucleotide-binding universal stress UspA family protein
VQFKRVLLATDFSVESRVALRIAAAIVKRSEGELFLLHGAVPPVVYGMGADVTAELVTANEVAARALMDDLIRSEPALKTVKHSAIISLLPILEALNQATADYHVDLIVTGTHAAHGLEKLAFGSVAEAMLRNSHAPVLVVPPGAKTSSMPFHSIVFATDLEIGCLRPAQYAAGIAEEMGAQLTVLHVLPLKTHIRGESRELAEKRMLEELKQLLPSDVELWCNPHRRVEFGETSGEILQVAQDEAADLIVMGMHRGALLSDHAPWATATKVIRAAKCPVLAVQAHAL